MRVAKSIGGSSSLGAARDDLEPIESASRERRRADPWVGLYVL